MTRFKIVLVSMVSVIMFRVCSNAETFFKNLKDNGNDLKIEGVQEEPELNFMIFVDCFEYAELVTGFSAEVLRGIAATESHFRAEAIGDNGMSLGMFQLHSRWHESRVKKWGEFDPIDPFDSAVIAAKIMLENLAVLNGDLRFAIAAYMQGVTGVRRNGVTYHLNSANN
jgi:hypothetical protein